MKHGFIKVGTATFELTLANAHKNADKMIELSKQAHAQGIKILVFPELSLCGSTCGDLLLSDTLLESCSSELCRITDELAHTDTIIIIGFPALVNDKIYNCAAFCQKGDILAVIPKKYLSNSEKRYFSTLSGTAPQAVNIGSKCSTMGNIIFSVSIQDKGVLCNIGTDIGAEAFAPISPSTEQSICGANIIVNPFSSCTLVGSAEYKHLMLSSLSARNICGYINASAGDGESTTDGVFGGGCAIYENGKLLASRDEFSKGCEIISTELDMGLISSERRRASWVTESTDRYLRKNIEIQYADTSITREYPISPFVPEINNDIHARCNKILDIQAKGLAQRIVKADAKTCVIGISGGLDSCLAMLVAARAMDILNRPRTDIIGVTMPCFGTTKRTKSNAELLCISLGTQLRCVNIGDSVRQHFKDIGHSEEDLSVVYENAQARERTQVIMDIANMEGGFVVGTGDLSELALGWATYNGDHMSMYGVNGGVPKTLIRHIVSHCADIAYSDGNKELAEVLRDILATPVSPELLPADKDGNIAQKTEDLVGPYEIHDFYIYYFLRYGYSPEKLYRIARLAFKGRYSDEVLAKWLQNLMRRFFAQQFKRSCLPDGPKIGTVGVSPRGDLCLPSDASGELWKFNI